MRLTDRYDGATDPFEGERTIVWSSLPQEAVVTKATITLEPIAGSSDGSFIETLPLGGGAAAFGATLTSVTVSPVYVDVDFHGRRRGVSVSGITSAASLAVDVGGGVFTTVGSNGTLPPDPAGSQFNGIANGILPGLSAARLRFINGVAKDPGAVTIGVISQPSNVTLRFGKLPTFWSKVGEISVATTTADITDAIQRALSQATVVNGYYSIPLVIHSDTLGRLTVTIDVTYVSSAPVLRPGLREVVLPYDYATVAKSDGTALQAKLPANAHILSGQTSLQVRGAFEQSRIAQGPTGQYTNAAQINCSATQVLAQPIVPAATFDLSAVDVLVATDQPAAQMALDLRSDQAGKPSQTSLLKKPAPFDLTGSASHALQWITVPIAPTVRLTKGKTFWLVLQALDGASAMFGTDAGAVNGNITQRSVDSGFSWRIATPPGSVSVRLRTVPDRFEMPIDFVAGSGSSQQRVSLQAYSPQGKVDAVIDRPELASALEVYVSQTAPPVCTQGERLQNPDFSDWSASGGDLGSGALVSLTASAGAVMARIQDEPGFILVETFFNTAHTLPNTLDGTLVFAYAADGSIFSARLPPADTQDSPLAQIDATTFQETHLVTDPHYTLITKQLAVSPQGQTLFALGSEPQSAQSQLVAIDLTSRKVTVIVSGLTDPGPFVLSSDGTTAYIPDNQTPSIIVCNLITGFNQSLGAFGAQSLALTADGKTLLAVDSSKQLRAVNTADGTVNWSMILTGSGPFAVATAANGISFYLASVDTSNSGSSSLFLTGIDSTGKATQPSKLPQYAAGTKAPFMEVTPQGDNVYVATSPMALDPAGTHLLIRSDSQLAAFPIGSRQPTAWTLTAGTITPTLTGDTQPTVVASLQEGSLSQVIPVSPSCFHDFSVSALAQRSGQSLVRGGSIGGPSGSTDAVAEVLWLDATGKLLRTDSISVPIALQYVNQTTRFAPPAGTAQAEVRARVAGGTLLLRKASLQSSDDVLLPGAWQSGGVVTHAGINPLGVQTFRNTGTSDLTFSQHVALTTTGDYQLNLVAKAVATPTTAPRIEIAPVAPDGSSAGPVQQVAFDSTGFPTRPARLSLPSSATAADIRIVVPPGTSLTVSDIELIPRATVSVPLSFVAQSPGELHVSNARVIYDLKSPAGPAPPPGGLAKPTPPDGTSGDSCCECDEDMEASSVPTKSVSLPRFVRPALARSFLGPAVISPATTPLTSVKGVGPARARLLQSAGILTADDLAHATSADVLAALASAPAATPELAMSLIANATAALTGHPLEDEPT